MVGKGKILIYGHFLLRSLFVLSRGLQDILTRETQHHSYEYRSQDRAPSPVLPQIIHNHKPAPAAWSDTVTQIAKLSSELTNWENVIAPGAGLYISIRA